MIPSAETVASYERLGIVGILLLLLFVGLIVARSIMKFVKELIADQKELTAASVQAITKSTDAVEALRDSADTLHRRLDETLSCPKRECPIRRLEPKPT